MSTPAARFDVQSMAWKYAKGEKILRKKRRWSVRIKAAGWLQESHYRLHPQEPTERRDRTIGVSAPCKLQDLIRTAEEEFQDATGDLWAVVEGSIEIYVRKPVCRP